jgi:hypothetical protein
MFDGGWAEKLWMMLESDDKTKRDKQSRFFKS